MIIKKATLKNKKEIDAFNKKEWKVYNKENNYVHKENKFSFAAYEGKEIIGSINGRTNGGVAYLNSIIVSKKQRKKGIGEVLLKKFEEIAKKNKCHVCLLRTTDKHPTAILFYKKNGYNIEATLNNMYWHVNEYYIIKRLEWKS